MNELDTKGTCGRLIGGDGGDNPRPLPRGAGRSRGWWSECIGKGEELVDIQASGRRLEASVDPRREHDDARDGERGSA